MSNDSPDMLPLIQAELHAMKHRVKELETALLDAKATVSYLRERIAELEANQQDEAPPWED